MKVPKEAHILAQSGAQLSRFSHAAWHDGSASIWRVRAVVILEMVRLERVIAASGSPGIERHHPRSGAMTL